MILYLAQKYSGIEEGSFMEAVRLTRHLINRGYTVFSPILHTHPYDLVIRAEGRVLDWHYYMGWDKALIKDMDCMVVFAPSCFKDGKYDWNNFISKGAKVEYHYAQSLGKKCEFYKHMIDIGAEYLWMFIYRIYFIFAAAYAS